MPEGANSHTNLFRFGTFYHVNFNNIFRNEICGPVEAPLLILEHLTVGCDAPWSWKSIHINPLQTF